jgi:hypothetical protein
VILRAMLVEIGIIDTHSPFFILFQYKNRVSYPLWVDYFFNESSRDEFSYFPFDSLPFIRGKTTKSLLLWYSLWIHIKTMLDQLLGHPWHIRWFPFEYVSVSPQETDEREFLFVIQARADDGCLG